MVPTEVLDAKLARRAKGEALLQLLLYSDLLAQAQGIEPELMHVALGGGGSENSASFRAAEYAAYYRVVRRRFEAHVAGHVSGSRSITAASASGSRPARGGAAPTTTSRWSPASPEGIEPGWPNAR